MRRYAVSSSNPTIDAPEGAAIVLFPLCDRRGIISEILQSDDAQPSTEPESLFFAWLLDLPASVDPSAAANAIFTASHRARVEMGQRNAGDSVKSLKGPSDELATARRRLYQLLHETRSPSFSAPTRAAAQVNAAT